MNLIPAPGWATTVLTVQLLLAFFVPPIELAGRQVFAFDAWCALWVALALLDRRLPRSLWPYLVVTALVIAVAFAQGYFRHSIHQQLYRGYFFEMREQDHFHPLREALVAGRFLCWLWAARIVASWQFSANMRRVLALSLAVCTLAAGVAMLVDFSFPAARQALGKIYGFDPDFEYWRARAYGVFRSPLEAGISLTLSALVLAASRELPRSWRWVGMLAGGAGVVVSKTFTAVIAAAFAIGFGLVLHVRRLSESRRVLWAVTAAALVSSVATALFWERVLHKVHDFTFRFTLWELYLVELSRSPRSLLLGFGMAPYHSDNIYVFALIRGGLVGLAGMVLLLVRVLRAGLRRWSWQERAIMAFLLVAGLTLDTLIYRHVVAIMLSVGIPILIRSGTAPDQRGFAAQDSDSVPVSSSS